MGKRVQSGKCIITHRATKFHHKLVSLLQVCACINNVTEYLFLYSWRVVYSPLKRDPDLNLNGHQLFYIIEAAVKSFIILLPLDFKYL